MRFQIAKCLAVAICAAAMPALAHAVAPTFVVKCVKTDGPLGGEKYGTYYFFLKDGFVKGFACSLPGRPCQIVLQNAQKIVFQTPGDTPDIMTIDLRTGAIDKTAADGSQWKYSCKQVPHGQKD